MKSSVNSSPGKVRLARVLFISVSAALGGFLFGFDSGVINGTVDALQRAFHSDAVGTGFNVASMLLGCAAGACLAGTVADKLGRKPVMYMAACAFIVSAWGSGIAENSTEFVLYRMLGGLAVGAASMLSPAYIGEIAPPRLRGRLIALQQMAIVLGLLSAFLSNYTLVRWAGSAEATLWGSHAAWQWMFWAEMVPAAAFGICLLLIPESPRYLVAAGDEPGALKVLSSVTDRETALREVEDIGRTVQHDRKPRMSDIFHPVTGRVYSVVWVGIALAILVQFTGINVVFYYGAVLWRAAGFSEDDALLTNVISGSVNVGCTCIAIQLVDRVGRKPLLLIGALGQAITLGVLAGIFATTATGASGGIQLQGTGGLLALLVANSYIAFFASTWGAVFWVMMGEMFPNKFRGMALAIAGMAVWVATFVVTISFPALLSQLGLGLSYGIYSFFGFVAFFFVQTHVQETRGKTLEEISLEQT